MTPAYQIAIGLGVCVGLFFLAVGLPRLVAAARECLHLRARGKLYGWPWWWSTARRRRRLAEIRVGGARPKLAEACANLLRGPVPSPAAIRREAAKRLGLPLDQVRVTRPDDAGLCVAVFGASHDRREQLRIELQEIVPIGIRIEVVDDLEVL